MNKELTQQPIEIRLSGITELRMGSPYNTCRIDMLGRPVITLEHYGWQDIYAWSEDAARLALIKWDLEENEPGFRVVLINASTGDKRESKRLSGMPETITVAGDVVHIRKFVYDSGKSSSDCYYDEDLQFSW